MSELTPASSVQEAFENSPRRRWNGLDVAGALLSVGLAALSCLQPYGRDQAAFAYVAREWALGNVPFKAVFEIKPPSIYLTYLIAFRAFGESAAAIHVMDYLASVVPTALACAGAVTPFGKRVPAGRVGLALAITSVVYYVPFDFWSMGQVEAYCSSFSVIAAWSALRLRSAARAGFGVGLAATMAVLYKPTAALSAVAIAFVLLAVLFRRDARPREYARAALAMGAGIALPVAVLFGYFGAKGALPAMHEALVVTNRQYLTAGSYVNGAYEIGIATFSGVLMLQTLLLTALHVLLFRGIAVIRTRPAAEGMPYVAAGSGLVTSVLAVMVQLKFFTYHWVAVVGFLAMTLLLFAIDLRRLLSRTRARWIVAAAVVAVLTTSGKYTHRLLYTAKTALHWVKTGDDTSLAQVFGYPSFYSYYDSRETGRWVRDHAAPGDTLLVRGFEPQIYMVAGLRYGGRFFESTWMTQKRFSTLTEVNALEDWNFFRANPPRWVVAFTENDSLIDSAALYESLGYVTRTKIAVFSVLERGPQLNLPEAMPW